MIPIPGRHPGENQVSLRRRGASRSPRPRWPARPMPATRSASSARRPSIPSPPPLPSSSARPARSRPRSSSSTGTGGGFKLFCGGVGADHPDVDQRLARHHQERVRRPAPKNGVTDIVELKIGFDGIVIANAKAGPDLKLTRTQVFLALAKDVPGAGRQARRQPLQELERHRPVAAGREDRSARPAADLRHPRRLPRAVHGPGRPKIESLAALRKADVKAYRRGLEVDPRGRRLYRRRRERQPDRPEARSQPGGGRHLRLLVPRGERGEDQGRRRSRASSRPSRPSPTAPTRARGRSSSTSRSSTSASFPGLKEFIAEYASDKAIGEDGYLAGKGLVPLPDDELAKAEQKPPRPRDDRRRRPRSRATDACGRRPLTAAARLRLNEVNLRRIAPAQARRRRQSMVRDLLFVAARRRGRSRFSPAAAAAHALPASGGRAPFASRLSRPLHRARRASSRCSLLLVALGPFAPRIVEHLALAAPARRPAAGRRARRATRALRDIVSCRRRRTGEPAEPRLQAAGRDLCRRWRTAFTAGALAPRRPRLGAARLPAGRCRQPRRRASAPATAFETRGQGRADRLLGGRRSSPPSASSSRCCSRRCASSRAIPSAISCSACNGRPQTAIREDQVGQSGAFGAVPLFAGTTLIMLIAMLVAGPIGLFAAIYMAEYASPRVRSLAKPVLEILAGVPTVVFGFFAALTVAPLIRSSASRSASTSPPKARSPPGWSWA